MLPSFLTTNQCTQHGRHVNKIVFYRALNELAPLSKLCIDHFDSHSICTFWLELILFHALSSLKLSYIFTHLLLWILTVLIIVFILIIICIFIKRLIIWNCEIIRWISTIHTTFAMVLSMTVLPSTNLECDLILTLILWLNVHIHIVIEITENIVE